MKEKPIIFSTDMVKAILEGRKTQTRRVIVPQPIVAFWFGKPNQGVPQFRSWGKKLHSPGYSPEQLAKLCPYGQVGDRLWVREAYWTGIQTSGLSTFITYMTGHVEEKLVPIDFKPQKIGKHPSIHLPRWASRITLENEGVRVERLQEISEEDAEDESFCMTPQGDHPNCEFISAREAFAEYWFMLNEYRGYGWDTNPWVWVIEFKKLPAGGV